MRLLTLILLAVFCVSPARAWNSLGHQAVAEVVWRQMSPAQRHAASELLRQHPHYQLMLLADLPAGVDTNEWAFLNAAVWLDRIRPAKPGHPPKPRAITQYDIYPHAIGYPFLRAGDTNRALLDSFFIARPDAEMVLSNAIVTLRDGHAAAPARAVSLCVVLHLCGDLHQPLHASNLVTQDRPHGSELGGACLVREPNGEPVSLHALWDGLPGHDLSYKAVLALADELVAVPDLQPARLPEYRNHKRLAAWVQESYRVAVDFAYNEKHVQFVAAAEVKCGKVPASAIPMLSEDYVRQARQLARSRLALAAQRLADTLKPVCEPVSVLPPAGAIP